MTTTSNVYKYTSAHIGKRVKVPEWIRHMISIIRLNKIVCHTQWIPSYNTNSVCASGPLQLLRVYMEFLFNYVVRVTLVSLACSLSLSLSLWLSHTPAPRTPSLSWFHFPIKYNKKKNISTWICCGINFVSWVCQFNCSTFKQYWNKWNFNDNNKSMNQKCSVVLTK